jgi:hypothetical protein
MRRVIVVGTLVLVGLCFGVVPAFAGDPWGDVTCSQIPTPDCNLGAGTGGTSGGQGGNPGSGHSPTHHGGGTGGNTGTPDGGNGDTVIGGGGNLANCSYIPSDYQPPAGAVTSTAAVRPLTPESETPPAVVLAAYTPGNPRADLLTYAEAGPTPGQSGAWYVWQCSGSSAVAGVYHLPVWIPNGSQGPGAPPVPSPAQLAQLARNQLRLPTPSIAANPAGEQLVNLPTWMWLSSGWGPVSATASVPGVSVTATATPTSVVWSMGDGSTVTCTGAGTPFPPGTAPTASSPDCGHTYRTSSAGQAGQAFPVMATVHWTVTWAGAGQGGVFPDMTTTGNAAFRVAESQALNTGG